MCTMGYEKKWTGSGELCFETLVNAKLMQPPTNSSARKTIARFQRRIRDKQGADCDSQEALSISHRYWQGRLPYFSR